jgi:hypothetical protein
MYSTFSATRRAAVRACVVSSGSPLSLDAISVRRLRLKSLCVIGSGRLSRLNSCRSFSVRAMPSRLTAAGSMSVTFSHWKTVFPMPFGIVRTSPAAIKSPTARRRIFPSSMRA